MYDKPVTVKSNSPAGNKVEVRVGQQLIRWREVDIRIRPDEFIEMTVLVSPDEVDIEALQSRTQLIVEERGDR